MRSSLRASTILIALFAVCAVCFPQTDPKNVPQPPTAELRKFDPFLGKYQVSGDFANLPWIGTLELKKVIKGWYIEQVILVKTEGIDREFRILATWDKNAQKYRLWGFQTLPIMPDNGGEIRFEGDEMITEWVSVRPDGSQVTSSNCYRFVSKDELEIVSFRQAGNDPAIQIGFLKGTRMLTAEEAAASPPDHSPANSSQPAPEMQRLAEAFEGTWSIDENLEPTETRPQGGVGHATEIWRRGPGGFTFMEEFRDDDPSREFGLALVWWDRAKGFQGTWCDKMDPRSCDISHPGNGRFQWDGKQQIVDYEFEKAGKTFQGHEVLAKTAATSFLQTLDIGVKDGPLKRWQTIHATRVSTESKVSTEVSTRDTAAASPEMQRLFRAFQGAWSYRLHRALGASAEGEEVWLVGPGGVTLIEDEHNKDASHELFGLGVTWWDAVDKGYRALRCDNTLASGCILRSKLARWEGADFVLRDQFERDGKPIEYKEVVSDITPNTYTQTIYQGEAGGELRHLMTIYASKVRKSSMKLVEASSAEAELRAVMAEMHKAALAGDTEKTASLMTDEYVQTDISGHVQEKTEWLDTYSEPLAQLIKAGKFHWEVYDEKDVQIRIYNDAAVVTGTFELKGAGARWGEQHTWVADPDARPSATLRFTRVFIQRNGKWLLAALHNAMPPPPANK